MNARSDSTVLTIGHSNHPLEAFVELLERHRVTALADVRSTPYSRFNPHFNRQPFAAALAAWGVEYLYLGRELGGRPDDPACYEDGRIRYDRVARTGRFREGLDRVVGNAAEHRIALMCAEKEPLDCHRTLLVGQALDERRMDVAHVHADGALEPHSAAMNRLLADIGLDQAGDLFRRNQPRDALIAEAIARKTGTVVPYRRSVGRRGGARTRMKTSSEERRMHEGEGRDGTGE